PVAYDMGGGGPDRSRIICCFLGLDERPFNPLLSALPAMIHLSAADAATGWLATLLNVAARDSGTGRPGRERGLARLAESVFVEAVRRDVEALPSAEIGWLAGLRDPVVGQALAALHTSPTEDWTVERLARLVGVSRSVLAERFTGMVGQPPMQYLALWRMQLASQLLCDGGQGAEGASAVGYEAEAAVSRAFKKPGGQAPATLRKGAAPRGPPRMPLV